MKSHHSHNASPTFRIGLLGVLIAMAFVALGLACQNRSSSPNSTISERSYNLIRFDREMIRAQRQSAEIDWHQWKRDHPAFFDLFFSEIIPLQANDSLGFEGRLKAFLQESDARRLFDTCATEFEDFSDVEVSLDQAFQRYIQQFPDRQMPDVYTFISGFNFQRFIFVDENGRDALGLGLDLFLGDSFPYARIMPNNPSFSRYFTRTFNRQHIPRKALDVLIDDLMEYNPGSRLIDQMIYNGKKLHILKALLPTTADTIIMEYSPEQLNWCRENELELYSYLLGQDLFYSSDMGRINKLINPSPQGPSGLPPETPGQVANFLGWQIVNAYMRRFPNTSLAELVELTDAQEILDQSKYKPRQRK